MASEKESKDHHSSNPLVLEAGQHEPEESIQSDVLHRHRHDMHIPNPHVLRDIHLPDRIVHVVRSHQDAEKLKRFKREVTNSKESSTAEGSYFGQETQAYIHGSDEHVRAYSDP
jgi:hypothetical protein